MAIKIELKPEERLFIGEHVLVNSNDRRMKIVVETKSRMLRESEMLRDEDAASPCDHLILALQRLYLASNPIDLIDEFVSSASQVIKAAPAFKDQIAEASEHVLGGRYYVALKVAKEVRRKEQALLALAQS